MKCCISRFWIKARWITAGVLMLVFTSSCVRITLPLLSRSMAKADNTFPLPKPALISLETAKKIQHLPMDQLTQLSNGPGIIIAPPSTSRSADANLARGMSSWLEWTLGGLPAFDKNASWQSYTESISYLQRHKVNSEAGAAAILAVNSGATHVAMGSLSGNKNHLSLTYQWRRFPGNQPVGKVISIFGPESKIVAQLPKLAEQLSAQLHIKSTFSAPTETTAQLQELGKLPLSPQTTLPDSAIASLAHLATISNPARMMYLTYLQNANYNTEYPSHQAQQEWQQIATVLITKNPSNTLAWQYIAETNGGKLWGNESKLIALAKSHPNNYLLHNALANMYAGQNNLQQQRNSSQTALRSNRNNPRAWTQLADAIFNEADSVRHACYWPAMNDDQQEFVTDRYEECVPFLEGAAKLAHHSAATWADISRTATFAGDDDLIATAMQKALEADPYSEDALRWAVQVYQPKWSDSPDELLSVVKRVVASPYLYVRMFKKVNQAIYASGFQKGTQESQEAVKKVLEKWLQEHPKDYAARSNYGEILWQLKDADGMKAQEDILIKQRPNDSIGYALRAGRFNEMHHYAEASEYYKKALQYDPDNTTLHYHLGEAYHRRAQYKGERNLFPLSRDEYQKSIDEDPNNTQFTDSYNRLADLYIYVFNDPQKAVELYSKAVSVSLADGLDWANLGHAHFLLGQKDLALQEGKHAQELGYTGQHILWGELQGM